MISETPYVLEKTPKNSEFRQYGSFSGI